MQYTALHALSILCAVAACLQLTVDRIHSNLQNPSHGYNKIFAGSEVNQKDQPGRVKK